MPDDAIHELCRDCTWLQDDDCYHGSKPCDNYCQAINPKAKEYCEGELVDEIIAGKTGGRDCKGCNN